MYRSLIRPLMFRLDPEQAHDLTLQALRLAGALLVITKLLERSLRAHSLPLAVDAFGISFPNPLGLAAGYDKDGIAIRGLTSLGFGHIEVGTVTPNPQPGNPRPRIYRIPDEKALINRMGFPGRGADYLAHQLRRSKQKLPKVVLGVNIGKNKDTPNETAADDYLYLYEKFSPLADYIAINVSSPNTIGLRRLQAREYLQDLLQALALKRSELPQKPPLLVKLAPDLSAQELDEALDAILSTGMDGVIATNTTISRENFCSEIEGQPGGLSGAPLTKLSRDMISEIHRRTSGILPIIGVGGIMTPEDAQLALSAGATLIQVYTGMIYAGPGLIKNILEFL